MSIFTTNCLLANVSERSEAAYSPKVERISDQDIKSRLNNMSSVIELNYTEEVGKRIREYTVNYRRAGERILGRVDLFFPLIENEISRRNLPDELKYVAVVESNLEPTARSKSGAVGLWQFIKSTGRMQGLKIDNYIDERKDPEKSTIAALDYLTYLYERFDDWTLAIAAYNCGPGNVSKAIRRSGSTDYWEIRNYLPRETQKYVPRIIAAFYLMQYYHVHSLVPDSVDEDLRYTKKINDGKGHNFYTLARDLEMTYSELKSLNPQFNTKYFPKNKEHLSLVIPKSKYEKYLEIHDIDAYQELISKQQREREQRQKEKLAAQRQTMLVEPVEIIKVIAPPLNIFSDDEVDAKYNISL